MRYTKNREAFLVAIAAELGERIGRGQALDIGRKVLRAATLIERLAVAQCNGDYPADNGTRKVVPCPECESLWTPESYAKGLCPDCRAGQRVAALLEPYGIAVECGGDPRGYTLRLKLPSGSGDCESAVSNERMLGVPVRS